MQHSCFWLNRVEAWFSALQRQVMDRGSFDDVAALQATLGRYVWGHNRRATRRGSPLAATTVAHDGLAVVLHLGREGTPLGVLEGASHLRMQGGLVAP